MTGHSSRFRIVAGLVVALLGSLLPAAPALGSDTPGDLLTVTSDQRGVGWRARTAELRFDLGEAGDRLRVRLNLFDDVAPTVELEAIVASDGSISWRASGTREQVLITTRNGFLSGSIHLGDHGVFSMRGRVDGAIRIQEAPPPTIDLTEPLIPPNPSSTGSVEREAAPAAADASPPTIDLLIVITDDVLLEAFGGSVGLAEAWMAERTAEINMILDDSNAATRVELVGAEVVSYLESGDIETDLYNLTFKAGENCGGGGVCDPEGHLDSVHGIRDEVGADVVSLVVSNSTLGAGIGWLTCTPNSWCNADLLFSVARFNEADNHLTVTHELGHNLGLRHDEANQDEDEPDTYARGHRNSSFATVMSYECTIVWDGVTNRFVCADTPVGRIPHFSNPDVSYEGRPTGIPIGDPGQADAVTHIDSIALTVATAREMTDPQPVGLVDPAQGRWFLRDGAWSTDFYYGNPDDYPFVGDWDCDGDETPGLYRQADGFVYLRNTNTQGNADITFFFGNPGDIPIAGDFNNDGCDTVSIYRPSEGRFFIINQLGEDGGGLGAAEFSYYFGNVGDQPFVGDFDGDGTDTIGLHRESTGLVYFRNSHTQGNADSEFYFGNPGDRLIAGDWNTDGNDSPAVYRPSNQTFYFRYTNTQGNADETSTWGSSTWLPVTGVFRGP